MTAATRGAAEEQLELRPHVLAGTIGVATWCALCGGLAASPAGFEPLIVARWTAAWLVAVPLVQIAWSGVGWFLGDHAHRGSAQPDDGRGLRSAAGGTPADDLDASWTLRLVATAMAVAVAFLLGDGVLPWTAVLLAVAIAFNRRRKRADGAPSSGRRMPTRVILVTLGPFFLSWLALGGASTMPLDARIAATWLAEVLGWIRLNVVVLTVGALLAASLTWADLRAIDPERSEGGRSVPAGLLPMAAVALALSGYPVGACSVALVTAVGWPVLNGDGTGGRRLARPTVWMVGLALFVASLALGWERSTAAPPSGPQTARALRPAPTLGYTAVGAAPRGVRCAVTAPSAESSAARFVSSAG